MTDKHLHIVSFNVPYPANYGGVIDVYHKLRWLKKLGIRIHLHCYTYGRAEATELEALCEDVFYYPRKKDVLSLFSFTPYIVATRRNKNLLSRLLADDYPVLLEGLHSCAYLEALRKAGKKVIYRESNIEHRYYYHLAKAENKWSSKIYHYLEALKLLGFEKVLRQASLILPVSEEETKYFKTKFPDTPVEYLPSFHSNDGLSIQEGKGEYTLYHGNLSVAENEKAALYLINEVFAHIEIPLIIAGLNPSEQLKKAAAGIPNISVLSNPDQVEMDVLIQRAHVHVLPTFQATGLKLKLLNVLYAGRFCVVNDQMLVGTSLEKVCLVENTSHGFRERIKTLFKLSFSPENIESRKQVLSVFNNKDKAEKLVRLIFGM